MTITELETNLMEFAQSVEFYDGQTDDEFFAKAKLLLNAYWSETPSEEVLHQRDRYLADCIRVYADSSRNAAVDQLEDTEDLAEIRALLNANSASAEKINAFFDLFADHVVGSVLTMQAIQYLADARVKFHQISALNPRVEEAFANSEKAA